jgi:hypothetical protein
LKSGRVEEMRMKDTPTTLKMACGENPKKVYGNRGETPMSRMGNAWVMRRKLDEAKQLVTFTKHFSLDLPYFCFL